MLKVIEGTKPKKRVAPDYLNIHLKGMGVSIIRYDETKDRSYLLKIVYHGVNFINRMEPDPDIGGIMTKYGFIGVVEKYIKLLTPRELISIFPVDKAYDGDKWEVKDYYYAMKVLKEHGMDTPIGGALNNMFFDYVNPVISKFMAVKLSTVSTIMRNEGGKGILEMFCEENGIDTYTMAMGAKDVRYATNNTTGEKTVVKKPVPRHLSIH